MFFKHLSKVTYVLICLLIASLILRYEFSVIKDRKLFPESKIISLDLKVDAVPSYSDGTAFFKAKPLGKSNIHNCVYVSLDHAEMLDIYPGCRLSLSGKISAPDKPLNPGGYDFGEYIKSIGASLKFDSDISRVTDYTPSPGEKLYKIRRNISERISFYLPPDEAGVVNALVTGDKSKIPDEIKDSYARAGIYHLLAVSGLHLNMVIMALMYLYMSIRIKKRYKSAISFVLTTVICLFMLAFTGFGMSVARAVLMAVFLYGAPLLHREYSPVHSLFWAFALIIASEPYAYSNASFCLSFSATAGIIAGVYFVRKYSIDALKFGGILSSLILSCFSSLMTLPFVISYFGRVSVISPISNLAVLIIAPLLLGFSYIFALACAILPEPLAYIASGAPTALAKLVNIISRLFASVREAYIRLNTDFTLILFFGFICILTFAIVKKKTLRIFVCSLFIIANTFNISYNIIKDNTMVAFLNASQGDCSIICTDSGKCAMIDCGSEDAYKFGENEVMGYLAKNNISKINLLFVTHFHEDHVNAICTLMENDMVEKLVVPSRPVHEDEEASAGDIYRTAAKLHIPIEHVKENDRIVFEKEHLFDIVWLNNFEKSSNESSMVISYMYGKNKILFTGDIEETSQYMLADSLGKHNIVKVPHHGGGSSMSQKFADTVMSEYAVISCGKNNRYSHPAEETLNAYANSKIFRTDTDGPVVFSLTKNKIIPR